MASKASEESKNINNNSPKMAEKAKKKKKKKNKDPNAPKRPLGPYFFYFKEYNTRIKTENPELIQKEVVAKIASNWKLLTEEQKAPYIEQSKEDKQRYVREKAAYEEQQKEREDEMRRRGNKRNHRTSSSNKYKNGGKRMKIDHDYPHFEEKEVRLVDILGADQISFGSNSEALAPYSPPDYISNDESKQKAAVQPNDLKRELLNKGLEKK